MSEFHEVQLELKDKEAIIEALRTLGYNPVVYNDPINLKGYQGDTRKEKAHIIVPSSQISRMSNDLGFEKVGNDYVMRISQYDISAQKFNSKEFDRQYKKHRVLIKVKNSRHFKKKSIVEKNGKITIKIKGH